MKRLSDNLSAAVLLVLVAAWVCSTNELVGACASNGCTDKCFLATGWCYQDAQSILHHREFNQPVALGGCTNGMAAGAVAILKNVGFTPYNSCVMDCKLDFNPPGSTAAFAGTAGKPNQTIVNTQCNTSSN